MPISDRLDEIQARYVEWHEDRGDHTPAPDTETWADADHPDESMEHCIVRCDAPAMLAALRSVLDLAEQMESERNPEIVHSTVNGEEVFRGPDHTLGAERRRWANKIRRAVEAALGES